MGSIQQPALTPVQDGFIKKPLDEVSSGKVPLALACQAAVTNPYTED
jgi:hypothetical protein